MNDLQRMNVEELIGALRSGEYMNQVGRMRQIHHDGDRYCAFGVACEIHGLERHSIGYCFPGGAWSYTLPPYSWVEETFGLTQMEFQSVYSASDRWGHEKAADMLKEIMNRKDNE